MATGKKAHARADEGAAEQDARMSKRLAHAGENAGRPHAPLFEVLDDIVAADQVEELCCSEEADYRWNDGDAVEKDIDAERATRRSARAQPESAKKQAED